MDPTGNANWWHFSIDPQERGGAIATDPEGRREVNPALPGGCHLLDYHHYIGLDQLLSCQMPTSLVPDERCFIITHQLFELAFKLMIFDLSVLAASVEQLLRIDDDQILLDRCCRQDAFPWLPAMTASARLVYTVATLLPSLFGFLASGGNRDETFNSQEFGKFRPNLQPASGFQSAQFRLIQRALGKAPLLGVRLFPAQEYWRQYEAAADRGPAMVTDPVILRDGAATADPPPDSPLAAAAGLDASIHRLLDRLAGSEKDGATPSALTCIPHSELEQAVAEFQRILGAQRALQEKAGTKPVDAEQKDRAAVAVFHDDLQEALSAENDRRATLLGASAGALRLRRIAPAGPLALVLQRVVATDRALHGSQSSGFLTLHFHLVAERIRDLNEIARQAGAVPPPVGTGGGGTPYLGLMSKRLIPLFPALVACRSREE